MAGLSELDIFVSDKSHGNLSLTNFEKLVFGINDSFLSRSFRNAINYPVFYWSALKNRFRFLASCQINPKKVFCPTLGIGDKIAIIDSLNHFVFRGSGILLKSRHRYDAIITNLFNFPLMFEPSDCPVLVLFDPLKKVLAKVHSGRENTIRNIAGKTVRAMKKEFLCEPADLIAIFPSPHLCKKCHFLTFIGFNLHDERIKQIMPAIIEVKDGWEFDLQKAIEIQIISEGIEKIVTKKPDCTLCNGGNHFSHRGWSSRHPHHPKPGRFAVVTVMKNV